MTINNNVTMAIIAMVDPFLNNMFLNITPNTTSILIGIN